MIVPRHAATLHKRLETHYSQIPFTLRVENRGHIQAENLVMSLKATGGTLHDRFVCYPLFGPTAPKPQPRDLLHPYVNFDLRDPPTLVGGHDMDFAVGPDRGDGIEVYCADFRHGREWALDGIACIDPNAASPFTVTVELTASNLRGKITQCLQCAYATRTVALGELIDLQGRGHLIEIPMAAQFRGAAETRNAGWFDFVREEDDEEEEEEQEEDDEDVAEENK